MYYWNNWYSGFGWFLWYGIFLLFFLSLGNIGYTYRAHRKFEDEYYKDAIDILNERYARGEIKKEEYFEMKSHILSETKEKRPRNPAQNNASTLQPNY